jgi:maleylacetoacetate isomerase
MLKLYNYWRSSSSYRVRIALNLKNAPYESVAVHLLRSGGENHSAEYHALNPQELVPLLVDGDYSLGQSLAIFHYLESRLPKPALAPADPREAGRMWSFCQAVACEIQPMQNTRVLDYLKDELALDEERRKVWLRHWIGVGLQALEETLRARPETAYCFGDSPGYADCCLVPQMYSAERFGAVRDWPRLKAINARCVEHPAFAAAHPDKQPDAQPS